VKKNFKIFLINRLPHKLSSDHHTVPKKNVKHLKHNSTFLCFSLFSSIFKLRK